MNPRFALLTIFLGALCVAGGCRGMTGGGIFARGTSRDSTSPSQPTSMQTAQSAATGRTTTQELIRGVGFAADQPGGLANAAPPLPPYLPEGNGPENVPRSGVEFVQTPFGPAERYTPGRNYLDQGPTVSGEMLARERAVTATERALELAEQLDQTRVEKAQLQSLIDDLQMEVQSKNELLNRAEKELASARNSLEQSEQKIKHWATETEQLKKRMESREKAHEKTFNELVDLINSMIDKQQSPSDEATLSSH